MGCYDCAACVRPDCGECINCRDKPRFGGIGKRKRACMRKERCMRDTAICVLVMWQRTAIQAFRAHAPNLPPLHQT